MPLPRTLIPTSTRTRLLAAAVVWTAVGAGLAAAGGRWLLATGGDGAGPALIAAGVVGWAKGRFVLGPRARANAERIAAGSETASLFEMFTPATWLLVGGMMAFGYGLRHSGLPWPVLGAIYAAVGVALLVGAVPCWAIRMRLGRPGAPSGSSAERRR